MSLSCFTRRRSLKSMRATCFCSQPAARTRRPNGKHAPLPEPIHNCGQAEAYEACLDWRSIVQDFLITERRSTGARCVTCTLMHLLLPARSQAGSAPREGQRSEADHPPRFWTSATVKGPSLDTVWNESKIRLGLVSGQLILKFVCTPGSGSGAWATRSGAWATRRFAETGLTFFTCLFLELKNLTNRTLKGNAGKL